MGVQLRSLTGAFSNCDSLTEITLPFVGATLNGTSNTHFGYIFGASSYYNNGDYVPTSLKKVTITGGTSIGNYAFYSCDSLTEITLPFVGATLNGTSKTHFGYIFGAGSYSNNHNYVPTSLKKVTITGGTSIGNYAFYSCDSLTEIVIPNSVTSIGNYAFEDCDSLTTVTFGDNSQLTSIGNYAFEDCDSLTEIVIPSSVTSIGRNAFRYCDSLTEIVIPNSVTSIGSYAFRDCVSLTTVTFGDNSQLTSIGEDAFAECYSLTTVTFGENSQLTSIGNYAFYSCDSLTTVTFGDNSQLTSIGNDAFYSCNSLTEIVIPDSVTSIGGSAFSNCYSLTEIVIPEGVTSIGNNAFAWCDSLTIYCEAASKPSGWYGYWNTKDYNDNKLPVVWNCKNNDVADDGNIYTVQNGIRYALKGGVATVVRQPYNITGSITIPASVTYKSTAYAVTNIGKNAFYNCASLTIYCEAASKPSGWDSDWNKKDSYGNKLPVVWDCKNNDVADDGNIYTVQNGIRYALKGGVATVVRQPRNITGSITIPASVTHQGNTYAVTSIGDEAFSYCYSLTEIVIPNSVTSMGSSAFTYCDSLTIYCEAASKPSGWSSGWNPSNRPVVWGYTGE
ncbi:MAG: leucine-rich repeat domain-containing protein [Clostridiales bacterium]|nr:leucine-rich repeat domain-containing protein [Clostridiales bacterium]